MTTDLALQALLMTVWRRKPNGKVTVHSDQGAQFTSRKWQMFLRQHNLEPSMSRRGNCHDNAVAESFFQLLKRERIRRRTYPTRDDLREGRESLARMLGVRDKAVLESKASHGTMTLKPCG
ncbi:hypothetical protein CCR78_00570 [Rhodovulum imhoffii]|nr:hypothetical protein [Rhodovulum imhoffii]